MGERKSGKVTLENILQHGHESFSAIIICDWLNARHYFLWNVYLAN